MFLQKFLWSFAVARYLHLIEHYHVKRRFQFAATAQTIQWVLIRSLIRRYCISRNRNGTSDVIYHSFSVDSDKRIFLKKKNKKKRKKEKIEVILNVFPSSYSRVRFLILF